MNAFQTEPRYETHAAAPRASERSPEIRWGAAWGGAVVGAACFAVVSSLWVALAWGAGGSNWWQISLEWWIGGTAIGAFGLAGAIAATLSNLDVRGTGVANAIAAWALGTLGALLVVLPLVFTGDDENAPARLAAAPEDALWIGFGAVAIGLGAAIIGGSSAEAGRPAGIGREDASRPSSPVSPRIPDARPGEPQPEARGTYLGRGSS